MKQADSGRFIGTVDDDLTALAAKVVHRLLDGALMVWVERMDAYTGPLDMTAVAAGWEIVGSYTPGESLNSILDDFQALMRERASDDLLY